jgi:hypothetical protein
VGFGKEFLEMVWVIYGMTLDTEMCGEDTYGLSVIMNLFIWLGCFKMILLIIVCVILILVKLG